MSIRNIVESNMKNKTIDAPCKWVYNIFIHRLVIDEISIVASNFYQSILSVERQMYIPIQCFTWRISFYTTSSKAGADPTP